MRTYARCGLVALMACGLWAARSDRPALGADGKPSVTLKAFAGEPFGVARVTVTLPPAPKGALRYDDPDRVSGLRLKEKNGRPLYPVFVGMPRQYFFPLEKDRPADPEAKKDKRPAHGVVAYFLFRGAEPLEGVQLLGCGRDTDARLLGAKPAADPRAHKRLLEQWWDEQGYQIYRASREDLYPLPVENYVLAMMSRRLKLEMPEVDQLWFLRRDGMEEFAGLLTGAESVRVAMQKKTLLREAEAKEPADQPLPKPTAPPAVDIPEVKAPLAVEPIALHVPVECFYVRCGSFKNFRWVRRFIDRWGTRVRDLTSSRGLDYGIRARMERQLALKETVLARLLGDQIIADVALIGTDTFVREGAAVGIVFQARNSQVLGMQIVRQRRDLARLLAAATEKTVTIAKRKVSLLATPDNAVRSFYVADGDYHLVTTSRAVARRFLEAGAGKDALGRSKEFRYARSIMPLSRNDTVFVYLSDPFFRNIVGPQYRVEMTRRTRALGKIQLVYLAQLAAAAEGKKADTVKDLIEGELLPPGFQHEPDGGRTILTKGRAVDSLRGAARSFLPVPDVPITGVTRAEAAGYERFARLYRGEWERMDPVAVGIRHTPRTPAGTERVVMDLYLTPYAKRHYEFAERYLGKADKFRVARVAGDLISLQALPQALGDAPPKPDPKDLPPEQRYRIFGALRDFTMPYKIEKGKAEPAVDPVEKVFRGYVGEAPKANLLGFISRPGAKPDKDGYAEARDGNWIRTTKNFAVLSNHKPTLDTVTRALRVVPAQRPAQIRLRIEDLSRTKLAPFLHAAGYLRLRKISGGNVHFLHNLIRQLRINPRAARRQAERILNARLVCPLGGTYAPALPAGAWRSSAWQTATVHEIRSVPDGFRFAPFEWLRGLSLEFSLDPRARTLRTRVELDLKPEGTR